MLRDAIEQRRRARTEYATHACFLPVLLLILGVDETCLHWVLLSGRQEPESDTNSKPVSGIVSFKSAASSDILVC